MTQQMMSELTRYGLSGLCIAGLCWFVLYIMKGHRIERREFRDMIEKISDKSSDREGETNKVLRDTTNILSGLKTLLENRR